MAGKEKGASSNEIVDLHYFPAVTHPSRPASKDPSSPPVAVKTHGLLGRAELGKQLDRV